MVFNSTLLFVGITLGVVAWLILLSTLLIRTISHYNKLTSGNGEMDLQGVLESAMRKIKRLEQHSEDSQRDIATLTTESKMHFQRIGMVRFNPFADTGGAQSFTMALLDEKNNGIVMTSLYARNGNKWYVKEVFNGKAKDMTLSKEEQAAIEKAKHIGN
jgi:hypothetical protein